VDVVSLILLDTATTQHEYRRTSTLWTCSRVCSH